MKKLGLGLLGLIVISLAGLLAAPYLIDWTAQKGRIAEQVRALTGRDVAIGGDVSLRLLPTPAFSAEKILLANETGGAADPMVELERLDVRVAFLPLLRGEIQVESINLVRPIIRLEVSADGRRNWDFPTRAEDTAATDNKASDEARSGTGIPGGVRLDSVKISDGTVIYRDAAAGREERLENLNATVAADSLAGPFATSGSVTARGLPVEFELSLGRLVRDGASPLNVHARLPGPDAAVQFGGALSIHADSTSLRGRLKGEGANLSALIAAVAGTTMPDALAKAFEAEGQLSMNALHLALSEVALRLDDSSLDGEVKLTFGSPFDAQVSLAASRLDLDRLLSPARAEPDATDERAAPTSAATATGGTAPPAPESASTPTLALPKDVTGKLNLAVEALVYRGQVVRQLLLGLNLADGRLDVSQALALLPGGSDVSVSGALTTVADASEPELEFAGRVEAASDNFRAILEWLGVDASAIPAERLRKMSLSSRVAARRERVILSDIDLAFDLSRATGGIAIAVRARPGLGIGLAVDKLNLDAYLPRPKTDTARAAAAPAAGANATADTTPATKAAALALALPAVFDRFDANLDLRLGDTAIHGMRAKAMRLDATLQQGGLTVRELRVGDVAGARVRLSGALAGLTRAPTIDASFETSLPEPGRLARALGGDPATLAPLGPIEWTGTLSGDGARLTIATGVDVLGGRVEAKGTLEPMGEPAGAAPAFDLALAANHPKVAALLGALAPGTKLDPAFGGLALSAKLSGTPARFAARDIAGTLGPTEIAGSIAADLGGTKPKLAIDLVTGALPLDRVLAAGGMAGTPQAGGPRPAPGTAGTEATQAARADVSDRWSRAPLDLAALDAFNGTIKIRSDALVFEDLRIENAAIDADLTDAVLNLREAAGGLYGGTARTVGRIDARSGVEAGLELTATGLDLAALAREFAKTDRISGPLDITASLTARGASQADLVSSLGGAGALTGTLNVKTKAEEEVGSIVLGILGRKIKEIRNVAGAATLLFRSFAGTPATLAGTFAIEHGAVRTDDLRVDGHAASALTRGTADLAAWRIDTRTDVTETNGDPAAPLITVALTGPLDKPNQRFGGTALQRAPAPAAPAPSAGPQPSGTQSATPAPAPEPAQPLKPRDALKQGLKDLLKGLSN